MNRAQALFTGFIGLLIGGGLSLVTVMRGMRLPQKQTLREITPNPGLVLEPRAGLSLSEAEASLLRALFSRYARLVLQSEFHSGYSGARTFLVQPVRPDGKSDAFTIVKVGPQALICREYANYETYVKDSLPPVTARIQQPPARVPRGEKAALQYTFIAEPGRPSLSLRQALLNQADPSYLLHLFETFGPNWWMQRRPYSFRLAQEYDHLLPPHYVLQPVPGALHSALTLTEHDSPYGRLYRVGDIVRVPKFLDVDLRTDGSSLTLTGIPQPGQPGLRLRWLSTQPPSGTLAQVVALRMGLLNELTGSFDLLGLPNPLDGLEQIMQENVQGTRSTIHGDLKS